MLKNFQYRGNYLNFNVIKHFIEGNHKKNNCTLPGFLPVEIDYELTNGEKGTFQLPPRESIYFSMNPRTKRKKILETIIEARKNTVKANELTSDIEDFIHKEVLELQQMTFVENEYVIPSCSSQMYDIDLISHKGNNLLHLIQEGYPVPDFCILSSKTYFESPEKREKYIFDAITNLEHMISQKFGSEESPLIIAMRSAMPSYIPGLMPTFLNVGVTPENYSGLCNILGESVAKRIYLSNLRTLELNLFGKYELEESIGSEGIDEEIEFHYNLIALQDEHLLHDAFYQVCFFLKRAYHYFKSNQDLLHTFVLKGEKYPSIILQKMVWTVRGNKSYPGVIYSRHARTGLGIQVESLPNIFGEEIMTGLIETEDNEFFDRPSIKEKFPAVYHFEPLLRELEKKMRSPVTVEFAAESYGNAFLFAILQLNASELTGRATLLSSIDLYKHNIIDAERVVELIKPYHLTQIFSDRIDDPSFKTLKFFCNGVSILPRTAVSARAYFSAAKAFEAKKRGEKVCICQESFVPADTLVMAEVDAIISLTPAAIHVVTACRGYGVPAFLNLEKFGVRLERNTLINQEGMAISEGDWITISSKRQKIFIGKAKFTPARFQRYLDGEKLEMKIKEKRVFTNMAKAFKVYNQIIENLQVEKIVKLDEIAKLVRTSLSKEPEKAENFMNTWFDSNQDIYIDQLLQSELGSHQDQHKLYQLLSLDRKILLFKNIIPICQKKNIKGYTAGSFMLGRFLCLEHPVAFWKAFPEGMISFMLNEYVLFEKYTNVLNKVGEREVNRARKQILRDGLGQIKLKIGNAMIFITLKLVHKNFDAIKKAHPDNTDEDTLYLIEMLRKPYGYFFNYRVRWSVSRLEEICEREHVPLPGENEV
ncbi:MAG: hypothetical protein JW794_07175 [Candidatus Cloacimonetes bacterium]|nr:hypothetical protein [Candidatus Cloacimonadota bacterium]